MELLEYRVKSAQITALASGDATNPVALFLHGIPANAYLWENILPKVSEQGWYCIAPHCPGYGATKVTQASDYTLEGSATLFIDWLQLMGWKNIWLVGHDIGGGIAQIMLTKAERLFTKVSLSNCATASTWPVPIIQLMRGIAQLGLFPLVAQLGLAELTGGISLKNAFHHKEKLNAAVKEKIFFDDKMRTAEGRAKFAQLLQQLNAKSTQNNMEALAQVQQEVHLIWGMKDTFQAWKLSGQILQDTLPITRVTKLESAGHFLQLDDPEAYIEALLS